MPLKAIITYKSKTKEFESGLATAINRSVEKSLAVMDRNIKVNTPVKEGHLKRSIHHKMTDAFSGEVFTNPVEGGTEVTYGVYLEYGTKYMAPRAMFRKGVAQSEDKIKDIFQHEAWRIKNGFSL